LNFVAIDCGIPLASGISALFLWIELYALCLMDLWDLGARSLGSECVISVFLILCS
jgi:hypothetical protein